MAILAALICGVKKNAIFKQLHKIKPVPGRLECIANLENNSKIKSYLPQALTLFVIVFIIILPARRPGINNWWYYYYIIYYYF